MSESKDRGSMQFVRSRPVIASHRAAKNALWLAMTGYGEAIQG